MVFKVHFNTNHSVVLQLFVFSGRRGKCSCCPSALVVAAQIRVDGTTKNTLEYEIVQVVDTGPILRDMAFSMDHEHLYIMSEKQVRNSSSSWCFTNLSAPSCCGHEGCS